MAKSGIIESENVTNSRLPKVHTILPYLCLRLLHECGVRPGSRECNIRSVPSLNLRDCIPALASGSRIQNQKCWEGTSGVSRLQMERVTAGTMRPDSPAQSITEVVTYLTQMIAALRRAEWVAEVPICRIWAMAHPFAAVRCYPDGCRWSMVP